MQEDAPFRLTLLGAGQLGGSFALALKHARGDLTIAAYDPIRAHSEFLLKSGAVDTIHDTPQSAVREADMVLIAAPLSSYRSLAAAIAPALPESAVVTDLGSVKATMQSLRTLLPTARIVGGHPIAGSEKSGPEVATDALFTNRLCILTPDETTDTDALTAVTHLWQSIGADVIHMPTEVHDQIYAYVSHLPHYIAFIAASYFHRIGAVAAAEDTTLNRFLRISRSPARMWTDVAIENREALLPVLATYMALLEHFATELRAGEPDKTSGDSPALAAALLPRILAASLISGVSLYEQQSGTSLRPFGAGGMRDIAAPAAITPEGDTEAISGHAHAIADHIDAVLTDFRTLENYIGAADGEGLFTYLSALVADAILLTTPRN